MQRSKTNHRATGAAAADRRKVARPVQASGKGGQGSGLAGGLEPKRMERLIENGTVIDCLHESLQGGEWSLQSLPGLVKRCLQEECWRERFVSALKEVVTFKTFEEFVSKGPPEGLGTDLRTLKNLCRDDKQALDAIDEETTGVQGAHNDNVMKSEQGNSEQYALRRLRKNRPDLHAEVIAGEKSAHAAMIEAGFRKVPTPLDVGKRAWVKMSKADRKAFLKFIEEDQ